MRALLLAVLLLAPSLAHAASWDAYLRLGSIWVTDPGFDLVSEGDSMPRFELGAGFLPGDGDRLVLELGYGLSSTTASLFESQDASLGLHAFQGSGLYRLPLGRLSRLLFRGTAALELATLELGPAPVLSDTAVLLALEATTGYEVQLPLASRGDPFASHLAFSVEAGYALRPFAADFSDLEPEAAGVAAAPIDVGELDLSSWVLRFGVALRF